MPAQRSAPRRAGLGRGLEALIPNLQSEPTAAPSAPPVSTIPVTSISPNPRQPRTSIDEDELAVLAESIRLHGVIQPIVVRPSDTPDAYTLIAGERRWRASQRAGLDRIPAVVMDVSLQAQLELALVENVIRSDLSPLEEAIAYRQLIDEFGLTQADVAERVGRSRVSVTNTLRLLLLPDRVKDALDAGEITEGHARALLGLPSAVEQIAMLETVIRRNLSVRETEAAVREWVERHAGSSDRAPLIVARNEFADSEQRLRRALSTNVAINRSAKGTGSIRIDFSTEDQLAEILDRIAGEALY
ncbi:MAG: ParB/RepB/Spo0J family partition protein [Thermomicrobiales bacterium]|nr:ParB/RepB/Spo0J family partition protein [Thermomicrobiales bacterium]